MSLDTAILLIAWRRPNTLRQVINSIRPVAPTQLFVACDGPNPIRPGEEQKVAATRSVIEDCIDWPCQIQRLYSDVNQGCALGVSRAITWFFENVEEGIILEDDCIPHPSFFQYCSTLLERYRFDTRIWCINGNNLQDGRARGDGSYYFSAYPNVWGWATWRRCWNHFDLQITQWPTLQNNGLLYAMQNRKESKALSRMWNEVYNESIPGTWDYQWLFACISNGGLSICPNQNLVYNIGFGEDATHTKGRPGSSKLGSAIDSINHPPFILRDIDADMYVISKHSRPHFYSWVIGLIKKFAKISCRSLRLPKKCIE